LPNGLTFSNANPAPSRMENGQPVWEIGNLITDSAMSMIAFTATVGNGLSAGTPLTITASISATNDDANPANSTDTTAVYVQSLGPDLVVHSDLEGSSLRLGKITPFSVTVNNLGTAAASGKLVVQLPVSATFKSAFPDATNNPDNKTLEWDLGNLAPNTSRTVIISVEVKTRAINAANPTASPLHFAMTTTAVGANDLFTDNNTITVDQVVDVGAVDLGMNLLMPEAAQSGEVITLTVPYLNRGATAAPSSVLSITWDSGFTLVDAQLITHSLSVSHSVITASITDNEAQWTFDDFPAGADGRAILHLKAPNVSLNNAITAKLISDAFDPDASDNFRTRNLQVVQSDGAGQVKVYLPALSR